MIDFATEQLLSFADVAKRFPGRNDGRVNPATVWRWFRNGCRAADGSMVKLEALRIGGRFVTSQEAVQRFTERLNGPAQPVAVPASPAERNRRSQRAAKKLAKAGI